MVVKAKGKDKIKVQVPLLRRPFNFFLQLQPVGWIHPELAKSAGPMQDPRFLMPILQLFVATH
jgi:hypothetical protein